MTTKETILNILNTTLKSREGASDLIYYLENGTDFFTAPASTIFHGNFEGGLAEHSLSVYNLLKEKVSRFETGTKEDTITICGLLHDTCKINTYKPGKKWDKDFKQATGQWREIPCYEVEDNLALGHGEKSVMVIQRFMKLTDEEMVAIRWHLGSFEPGTLFPYPAGHSYKRAREMYPLVTLLYTADVESSEILEKQNDNK